MANVAIYGSGGFGRLVRDILLRSGHHRAVAFLDSDPDRRGKFVDGLRVIGDLAALAGARVSRIEAVIVAIGDNAERTAIAAQLRADGVPLASAIHPLASISPSAQVDEHVIIGARVHVCVHAQIGRDTVLSAGAIVEHDNEIGSGVFVHPAVRLAGGVIVEDGALIGIGACVIPGLRIGRDAEIEAGAVVIGDVPAGSVAGGVPARLKLNAPSQFVAQRTADAAPQPV